MSSPAAPAPTPAPPACYLATGDVDYRGHIYAYRPLGTQDWLLTLTAAGRALFNCGGRSLQALPGDVVLVRPGTPHDYYVHPEVGRWKNIWAHFVPKPEALDWMVWPEVLPGHFHLRLSGPVRSQVWNSLQEMHRFHTSVVWRKSELAMGALDRALLLCDGVNPRNAETQRDPRIVRAVDAICRNLRSPLPVADLARHAALSRSRFVQLFHREMGIAPRDFVEVQRLARAEELLNYSSMTVAQVAEAVGFDCPFYFSIRFKKHFGAGPRSYRASKPGEVRK